MDMPEIRACCFVFPPRYASYLISLVGLGIGGVGLAGIILYGLVENSILGRAFRTADPNAKKLTIMVFGLTSLLLVVSCTLLFLGVTFSSKMMVCAAKWVLLVLCFMLLIGCALIPMSCFFMENACFIKRVSTPLTVFLYLVMEGFISTWMYLMVVVDNFERDLY